MHLTCNSALVLRHGKSKILCYFQSGSTDAANLSGDSIPTSRCAISIPICISCFCETTKFMLGQDVAMLAMHLVFYRLWNVSNGSMRTCARCLSASLSPLHDTRSFPFQSFWCVLNWQISNLIIHPNTSMAIETCPGATIAPHTNDICMCIQIHYI